MCDLKRNHSIFLQISSLTFKLAYFHKASPQYLENLALFSIEILYIICVTAAGFGWLLPGTTLGRTMSVTGTGRAGRNDDSVRDGVRILIY